MTIPRNFATSTTLDREYDPAYLVRDAQRYLRWYVDESLEARQEFPWSLDVPYGPGRDETVDIAPAPQPNSPVVVFIHGGHWQSFSSKDFSFVARGLCVNGLTVVLTNHSRCPDVTIGDITRQSRAALKWIYENIRAFHGDPERIFVVGHSAGGHQVAMLLSTRWFEDYGLPRDLIKGAVPISGIFDLRPLRQCSMQKTLGLNHELVLDQSPLFQVPDIGPPLLVSVGDEESSEFLRQSKEYLGAWHSNGLTGRLFVQRGRNHFDAIEGLADPNSLLSKTIVEFIAQCEVREDNTGVRRITIPPVPTHPSTLAPYAGLSITNAPAASTVAISPPTLPPKAVPIGPPIESVRRHEPLAEPSLDDADFAAWQRNWPTEAALAPKLAYWKSHLSGFSELPLPTDFTRPQTPTGTGARVPISVSADLVATLRALAKEAGVTLFTTLLAAWKTLLFRYTGQNDIIVGSATAGRPSPEFEGLIGYFNNNLVLRTQLDAAMSFADLLPKVGNVLKEAREHQDVPFDRLVAELGARRGPHENPLYNNRFILMDSVAPLEATPDWSASRIDIGVAKVDLSLELHQRLSLLVGHIEYQTELFAKETIERMVGHFGVLLESIVQNPKQRLGDLPILTRMEQVQLAVWQGPRIKASPADEFLSLEELFEAQAKRSPTAIAVEHDAVRLTYVELDARANRLASYLRSLGVGPDTLVGLCIERSIDAMVAILGVLKAGGAYVPLDPSYPRERLRFMIEDASIALLLTNRKNAGVLPEYHGRTIMLDEEAPAIAAQAASKPVSNAGPKHLAYIIYTSGSTGRPKGVMVERQGLYYLAKAQEHVFGIGVGTRVLQFSTINFDGSVWDFTLTWPVGATLVLAAQEAMAPGLTLAHFLQEAEIHVVMLTPSTLTATPYRDLPALRLLISAGEVLPAALVDSWAPGRHLYNVYAPTETTVVSILAECFQGEGKPPIGQPFDHVPVYILDSNLQPVPIGIPGELYIGGPGVARGYLNQPQLTASRFIDSPFTETAGTRLYKTGDRVKWRPDGRIDYLGRTDHQVKLRGFRIELGEVEVELGQHYAVEVAAVRIFDIADDKRLVAYVVPTPEAPPNLANVLKTHLRERLPEHMVPTTFITLDRMPLNPSGKIDRVALPAPILKEPATNATTSLEQAIAAIWAEILGRADFGFDTPFFEAGGHSLLLARVQVKLLSQFGADIDMITMLRLPTIRKIAAHLATLPNLCMHPASTPNTAPVPVSAPIPHRTDAIAVIGMAIRAPGVRGPDDLWEAVRTGRETIRRLDPEALVAAGADPSRVQQPNFIAAEGILENADHFDAAFFGLNDADATWMDPQQRLFLECGYEALEHAGYDPSQYGQQIGVFAGAGIPRYWMGPVADALRGAANDQERYRAQTLNATDFLATRVAFKLGLRGPAIVVQTACSTSLSAIHMARQSLLAGDCDMAIAGGVSLSSLGPKDWGYLHVEGGIESADGHCRPFDADASGLVKSSGVAIVVLKRLADAIADRDTIHAVILGSAMNNDGSDKVGFTAPSEVGIASVITKACEAAGVDPATIEFVETHGTGTRLGDPTEVRALTRAYRKSTDRRGYCALGALKANIGHLDAAAGAAGLIKATLALEHATIPAVPGYRNPNPLLDLPTSPFYVSDAPRSWSNTNGPRRAGVNALGLGGTNVHVILEEPPAAAQPAESRPFQLLCLSARTPAALSAASQRLRSHLGAQPTAKLADVAYTLAVGRAPMRYRMTVVCRNTMGAMGALMSVPPTSSAPAPTATRPVVFLFPGHGAQYLQMGADLYEAENVFRTEINQCFDIVRADAKLDLGPLLSGKAEYESLLDEMRFAQPFLFAIEYALAKQLMAWGVHPSAMLGHSLGEYVAACIAGVLSLRDALALVVTRGKLMDATPAGSMLTVFTDAKSIEPFIGDGITIATYGPNCVVLSGPTELIDEARKRLANAGIETNDVRVSRASHSPMMYGIRDDFRTRVAGVDLKAPGIPLISNITGKYMSPEQAMNPDAWADHLCHPVRLADSLGTLLDLESPICVEVGPGSTLTSLLKAHPRYAGGACEIVGTLPSARKRAEPSQATLLRGLGRLWALGVDIDWQAFYAQEERRRIPLPTYPFEGRRYNLEPPPPEAPAPLDMRSAALARELGALSINDVPSVKARLEHLCAHLVLDFFARRLGHTLEKPRSLDVLREDTGVLPKYTLMFEYLVQVLERAGMATRTSSDIVSIQSNVVGRSAQLAVSFRRDEPRFLGLVLFLEHCVTHYDEALTGEIEPVGVLYPDGTDAFYEECMRENAPSYTHVYTALTCDVIVDIVRRRNGQKTRILEVGGGHGRLTWSLVDRLREENVEYHFTDIGRSFLHRAEREAKKRGIPWMRAFRFDLNRTAREQGIEERYDVIVGLDSVHLALDLPAGLARLRDMLVPGGALVCIQATRINAWGQLAFGLAPGYWDIVRARGEMAMSLSEWHGELMRSGFARVEVVPKDPNRQRIEECGLLIAEHQAQSTAALANTWRDLAALASASNTQVTISTMDEAPTASRIPMSTSPADSARSVARHLWERMLGASRISPEANFFDSGGDSLLVVQMLSELRARTGLTIKASAFFATPTLEGLMNLLRGNQPQTTVHSAPPATLAHLPRISPTTRTDEPRTPHPDENAIVDFIHRFVHWIKKYDDAEVIKYLWADNAPCVLVRIEGSIVAGRDAIQACYARSLVGVRYGNIRISNESVNVLEGGTMACATAVIDAEVTRIADGRQTSYRDVRITWVLMKQRDGWRALQAHYSVPVADPRESDDRAALHTVVF